MNKHYGDLDKAGIVFDLCEVPHQDRDQAWQQRFFENVPGASFRTVEPQLTGGPDGLPYFQFLLPVAGEKFQCIVLKKEPYYFLTIKSFFCCKLPFSKIPLFMN